MPIGAIHNHRVAQVKVGEQDDNFMSRWGSDNIFAFHRSCWRTGESGTLEGAVDTGQQFAAFYNNSDVINNVKMCLICIRVVYLR